VLLGRYTSTIPNRLLIVLVVVALVPYVVDLGGSTIWDANEAYYVETPREMIESGDYVNPSFNYEPRFNKPVLAYWIVAALYHLFGVSVAVERAAIAAAAMAMIGACALLARAASAHREAGVIGAIGLAVGPRLFMFSRRILIDLANSAAMTLTLLFFVLSERYPLRRRTFLTLMYVSVGVGVLTKGPVAAALPALVFVVYLGLHREWRRLSEMMLPQGVVIVLAIAAPWYVLLYGQHGWTHITQFFVGENLERFTSAIGGQRRGFLFYLPVVLSDAFPWSLCLGGVLAVWLADRRARVADVHVRIQTLLLIWIGVIVLFFSLSQTKQDLYVLPVAPAVAALGGGFVARVLATARRQERRWLTGALTALGLLLVVTGAFVVYVFVAAGTVYAVDGALLVGTILAAGGVVITVLTLREGSAAAVVCTLGVVAAVNWILVLRVLPSFERYKPVVPLSDMIARRIGPDDVVAHYDVALPSMVFYLRRHIEVSVDRDAFLTTMRSGKSVFAVLPENRYEELKSVLGIDTCVLGRHPTSDVKLGSVLARQAPPEVVLIGTRCQTE